MAAEWAWESGQLHEHDAGEWSEDGEEEEEEEEFEEEEWQGDDETEEDSAQEWNEDEGEEEEWEENEEEEDDEWEEEEEEPEPPAKRQKFSKDVEWYANRNIGQRGTFDQNSVVGKGTYKYVVWGTYKPSGKDNVNKFLHSGTTFSDDCFDDDVKAAEAALPLIARFNEYISSLVPAACIKLNIPEVWTQVDGDLAGQKLLVEPYIEHFTKFNSNTGAFDAKAQVAQALSHFSFHASDGTKVLCDLQGGKHGANYVLSDIVVLSVEKSFGPTDLGLPGIENFFNQHKCNQFCSPTWRSMGAAKKFFKPVMGTTMIHAGEPTPFKPEAARQMRATFEFLLPSEIFFTQDSIKDKFQDGRSLLETALEVAHHDIEKRTISLIRVVWSDVHAKYYSLDNRRLAVFRLLGMCSKIRRIKCAVEDLNQVRREWNRKFDSKTNGETIRVRGADQVVGTSVSNTTYNLSPIQLATAHSNKSQVKDEDLKIYLATALADE